MTSRIITKESERDGLFRLISARDMPFTVAIKQGKHRTNNQNALMHKWFQEIATQLGDRDASEVKAHCKLEYGIKMLHSENMEFQEQWNRLIRGRYTHEELLALMLPPHDYPVSRIMNTKQMVRYMDAIQRDYSAQGVHLTDPEGRW